MLFLACAALERGGEALDDGVLVLLEDDHTDTGDALVAMRELAADYDTSRALCGTHRALLEALRRLELDLHQHVHEENNILFPRVRALAAAGTPAAGNDGRACAAGARVRRSSQDAARQRPVALQPAEPGRAPVRV